MVEKTKRIAPDGTVPNYLVVPNAEYLSKHTQHDCILNRAVQFNAHNMMIILTKTNIRYRHWY